MTVIKKGSTLSFDTEPIAAVGNCANVNRCNKRLMSSIERKKKQRVLDFHAGKSMNKNGKRSATLDLFHVRRGGSRIYHCNVCGDRGHNQYKCQRLENDFGAFLLGNIDKVARYTLITNILSVQSLPGYPIFQRRIDDVRNIINQFPKKVSAIVLYRRFSINAYPTGHEKTTNVCIECTIIKANYEIGERFLFEPMVIVTHIVKCQTNDIVNILSKIY